MRQPDRIVNYLQVAVQSFSEESRHMPDVFAARNMKQFFEMLGAPLRNSRWSWGARRLNDGAIFLRQWESDVFTGDDSHEYVIVAHNPRSR